MKWLFPSLLGQYQLLSIAKIHTDKVPEGMAQNRIYFLDLENHANSGDHNLHKFNDSLKQKADNCRKMNENILPRRNKNFALNHCIQHAHTK